MLIADTERLLIRKLTLDDVPALAAVLGDPAVMRYSTGGVRTEGQTRQYVEWCLDSYARHGFGQWGVVEKASVALVGFCGLSVTNIDGAGEVGVAYRLARRCWGQGLATEAASHVLAYGFGQKQLKSVVAIIAPDHKASIRVAEKVGFSSFACAHYGGWKVRVYRQHLDEWRDHAHVRPH